MSTAVHHIAIFVSEMEKTLRLFQKCLDFQLEWRLPRAGGPKLSAVIGLPEMEAEIAYLHARPKKTAVELVRLIHPSRKEMNGAFGVPGTAILSLLVEDMDSLTAKLNEEGWVPLTVPLEMRTPEGEPIRVCCVRIEDGLSLELFESKSAKDPTA
jgi:catechol 2,3-dioxygenase-like lactoylglutathione lyase family enzyme